MLFARTVGNLTMGFTRTVGNLEYLKKKVKFLGVHQGGMITVGIDLMI
jgi:hypothetical protein